MIVINNLHLTCDKDHGLYKWALLVSCRSIGQVQSTQFVVVFLLCTVAAPAPTACYLMNHLHFIDKGDGI